jgi:hypothetical protein
MPQLLKQYYLGFVAGAVVAVVVAAGILVEAGLPEQCRLSVADWFEPLIHVSEDGHETLRWTVCPFCMP